MVKKVDWKKEKKKTEISPLISCVCLDHLKMGSLPNADFNEDLPKAVQLVFKSLD